MILLRLSGHSCAGKTRLVEALPKFGLPIPKVLRYTSRAARPGEFHGQDYYFMSRAFIQSLPEIDFLVGPVRNMLQAFDLEQLELDLRRYELVLIEIHPTLWPRLLERMKERIVDELQTASIFMTAVNPENILNLSDDRARAEFIAREVKEFLVHRNKDEEKDIEIRAQYAASEILGAIGPEGRVLYDLIIHSSPEGPDGRDEWTRQNGPAGQAKAALEQFISFISDLP
jgi:hypothetical protein